MQSHQFVSFKGRFRDRRRGSDHRRYHGDTPRSSRTGSRRRVDDPKPFTDQRHLRCRRFPYGLAAWRIECPALGAPRLQRAIPFAIVVRKGGVHVSKAFHLHSEGFDHTDRRAAAVCDDAEGAHCRQGLVGLHTAFVQKLSLTYYTHNLPFAQSRLAQPAGQPAIVHHR